MRVMVNFISFSMVKTVLKQIIAYFKGNLVIIKWLRQLIIIGFIIAVQNSYSATIQSVTSGNVTWNTNGAWTGGVQPQAGDIVIIRTGVTIPNGFSTPIVSVTINSGRSLNVNGTLNFSTITVTGILNFNSNSISGGSITISAGTGNLFVNSSGTINLTGNFTNNGTFINSNTGSVSFNGTTTQTIDGSIDFNNIDVSTGAIVALSNTATVTLNGILTVTGTGTFDADGTGGTGILTIISTGDDPTTDASIASLPSGTSIVGNITVQRFMAPEGAATNTRIYRYISSPVQNATVADLQNEIPVTGTFTGVSSCSGCITTKQSMWLYDESVTTGTVNDGYVDFPSTTNTETFQTGKGYNLYVRGDLGVTLPTWDLRGPINSGTVNFGVTFNSSGTAANDGWNLVGNPYPSTIDWDNGAWTKTNVSSTIYMRDNGDAGTGPGGGAVATYNSAGSISVNGGSSLIAMGQGFWVQTTSASPVLSATEAVKSAGSSTTFFRKASPKDLVRVSLAKGISLDETVIYFHEEALNGMDPMDSWKFKNSNFNLSTLNDDGDALVINSLSHFDCSKIVKFDMQNVAAGNYQLNFSEFETFDTNTTINLKDNFTNTTVDIKANPSYGFEINATASSSSIDRFSLIFSKTQSNPGFSLSTATICSGSDASIIVSGSQNAISYTVLSNDQPITVDILGNGSDLTLAIPKDKLLAGENNLIVKSYYATCNTSIIEKPVSIVVLDKPAVTILEATKSCLQGAVSLKASGAPSNGKYNWYETENSLQPIVGQSTNTFVTPVLQKSKTYYVTAANSLGCEGIRKPVVAEIINYDPVSITHDIPGTLKSSYEQGNQWYKDGELIAGALDREFLPQQSGKYKVEVTVNGGCTTISNDFEFVILKTQHPEEVETITGIESNIRSSIEVFPNPVTSILTVRMPKESALNESTIVNSMGQEIGRISFVNEETYRTGQYDMTLKPAGLYFLKVVLPGGKVHGFNVLKK